MMKYRFLLLLTAFAPALFGQQIMTVSVDQDNFIVCPDEIVEVKATGSPVDNNSIQFDGATHSLAIPNDPLFKSAIDFTNDDFTIEIWVNTLETKYQCLAAYTDADTIGWTLYMTSSGDVVFGAKDNSGGSMEYLRSTALGAGDKINTGQWKHVAVTWRKASNNQAKMFIDGVEVSNRTLSLVDISHSNPLTLGYGATPTNGSISYFKGELDEFRIWRSALAPNLIVNYMSNYLQPSLPIFSSLAVNFDFNETTSSSGWKDCANGIIAPFGTSVPTVNIRGGLSSMKFNYVYTWTNISGNIQNGANYQKSFKSDDTVVVELGYCKYLCSDTVIVQIADCDTVRDPRDVAAVFMPTAFTPNGDTRNDYYTVKANAISYFEIQIYNRDGNILFHSKDIQTGWDGTFEGKLCMEGVYTAQVLFRDIDGEEFIRYQHFNLMR